MLQILKEIIKGDKEIAKYYYQWKWIKQLFNGMYGGVFVNNRFSYLFRRDFRREFIPLKRKYKRHWNRPIWKHIKECRFYLDGYKCVYCGATSNLQCHHKSYENIDTDKEIWDCVTVCYSCHQLLHSNKAKPKRITRKWKR